MADVTCARCGERRQGLDGPPMGGAIGEQVAGSVCRGCWEEWRAQSARLINHYGLSLGDPAHRARLRQEMKTFLKLESVPPPGEAGGSN